MPRRTPFDFDISVSADKKRRARLRGRNGAGTEPNGGRVCEHPNCSAPGLYRAPAAPDRLDEFRWFCLDHVREYNRSWNYFRNASQDELEQALNANVWDRPTWKFGEGPKRVDGQHGHSEGNAWRRLGFDDPLDLLGENATRNPGAAAQQAQARPVRRLPQTERRALDILGARDDQSKTEIRKMYVSLVKDLHPDVNAGRRDDEDRLREVVWAWDQIRASRSFRD
ncbi:MAG: DnaJ domain-containing protein [Pseudomonadota bacterium]